MIKSAIKFFTIDDNHHGQRIDNFLFKNIKNVPRSHIYKIINSGEVRVNKKRIKPVYKVKINDIIRTPPISQPNLLNNKQNHNRLYNNYSQPLILFEDDHYLIINKPAGRACHGGGGISQGLIEQMRLQFCYKFLELVHRLDKNTAGILVFAKKRAALVALQRSIKQHQVVKEYTLLSLGNVTKQEFTTQLPLYKFINKDNQRLVKVDFKNGKPSHTEFKVITKINDQNHNQFTLLKARLLTGRTHQIRVHMQYINHPILGDDKYGNFTINNQLAKKYNFNQMFLFADFFSFKHYNTNQEINIKIDLPKNYQQLLNEIKKND